jgi:CDP-glucose 4,6-dehydratase
MESLVDQLRSTYSGKRVLITGHNGFKGSWLVAQLNFLGAKVYGISLEAPENSPFLLFHSDGDHASYVQDIRDFNSLKKLILDIDPEIVFHLAAQSLVLDSYQKPRETFEINVQGTANLLEAVLSTSCLGVVVATTDKVYRNENLGAEFKESDELWGHDPYSLSKTGTELVVAAWRNLNTNSKCNLVSVRAGNVFGPGDRAHHRLIPDLVRGMSTGEEIQVRNPDSVRPWQFVLDPLLGYLLAGSRILRGASLKNAYNFGPEPEAFITVGELVVMFSKLRAIKFRNDRSDSRLESKVLKLNSDLAKADLRWKSSVSLDKGLKYLISLENDQISKTQMYVLVSEHFSSSVD